MPRPTKIDRMPAEIRELIGKLRSGGRTIDEIREKLVELDVDVARSTLGRYIQKEIDQVAEIIKRSRGVSEAIIARFGEDLDQRSTRLNAEILNRRLTEMMLAAEGGVVELSPRDAKLIAEAMQRSAAALKLDADRIVKVRQQVAQDAAKAATGAAKKAGLSAETIAQIERDVLGIAR